MELPSWTRTELSAVTISLQGTVHFIIITIIIIIVIINIIIISIIIIIISIINIIIVNFFFNEFIKHFLEEGKGMDGGWKRQQLND